MKKKIISIAIIFTLILTSMTPIAEATVFNNSFTQAMVNTFNTLTDKTDDYFKEVVGRFNDMGNHWSDVTIGKLVDLGVIDGYEDGTFKPNDKVTRAEFSKMVYTSANLEEIEGNSFTDTSNHWAKDYINTLVEIGGIDKTEYGDNYNPNKNITRLEMAKMVVRTWGLEDDAKAKAGVKTSFNDDLDIEDEDKGYIIIASDNEIIKGYPDNTFKPDGEATRAEASTIIVNTLEVSDNLQVEEKTEEETTKERVDKTLEERDFEVKLPNDTESVAVNEDPKTQEELIENVETLKVYPYTTRKRNDWELIAVSQFVSNTSDYRVEKVIGVIRMEWPDSHRELSTVKFEGKTYDTLHCDDFIEDMGSFGNLINDGEIIQQINNVGDSYFSLGAEGDIFKADYIGFKRDVHEVFTDTSKYDTKYDQVLILFENPFKE